MLRNKYNLYTHLFFLAMMIFALIFAKERFQADGAYYLFKVVNSGHFQIEHQRYILIFSQWMPLLGAKMGLSLNAIFILNSLGNILFFYFIFCYCVYYLRDETAGVAVILFQCLGVLHLQFTPMYEIWYGTMLLVPIRSHLVKGKYFLTRDLIVIGALMITVLFSHPLLFIPLLFILMLDVIEKWIMNWKLFILVVITFGAWFIVKKLFLSDYEAGKISMLDTRWNKAYLDLLHPSYYWFLTKFFFTYYTIPVLVYITLIIMYLVRGTKRKAIFVSLFFFGHIGLVNFTHVCDPVLTPYFERMYMPLMPIVFFPFLYDIFTQFFLRNAIGAWLIALVIVWRIGRFVDVGLDYRTRAHATDRAIAQAQAKNGSKFELNPADYKEGGGGCMQWADDWSFPMETMLRSAAIDKNKTVTIATWFDFEENGNRKKLNDKNYMMRRQELMPDNSVNEKYFVMKDGAYVLLDGSCR
ncbi:MAG: hypothetical protein HY064_10470 [Bacteroidetes bacterium]|nr:hypothetical protein [Bacteroidota bacterium]